MKLNLSIAQRLRLAKVKAKKRVHKLLCRIPAYKRRVELRDMQEKALELDRWLRENKMTFEQLAERKASARRSIKGLLEERRAEEALTHLNKIKLPASVREDIFRELKEETRPKELL